MEQTNDVAKKQSESTVAWYKLASLIARKEREKTLNVYRLLAHSFDDKAYALQIEGDILWALEDQEALEKYKQAAYLYKKEQRLVNAICVCEHLITLDKYDSELFSVLFDLYSAMEWKDSFVSCLARFGDAVTKGKIEKGIAEGVFDDLMAQCDEQGDQKRKAWVQGVIRGQKGILPDSLTEKLDRSI